MTLARCGNVWRTGRPPTNVSFSFHSDHSIASWFQNTCQTRSSSLLAYEEVAAGAATPAHPAAPPSRTLFVLHGLLGCGRNWRTWTKRLVEAAASSHPPEGGPWRALLVDLRCHGGSSHRPDLQPPNNLVSAAADVSRLVQHMLGSQPPGAVLGHSMGGKVALALLQQAAAAAAEQKPSHPQLQPPGAPSHTGSSPKMEPGSPAAALLNECGGLPATVAEIGWCAPPRQLWVLDSQPGLVTADQDSATGISRVLSIVHSVPLPIPNRAWLLSHLRERGLSKALANWLASNLVPSSSRGTAEQLQAATTAAAVALGSEQRPGQLHHPHHPQQQLHGPVTAHTGDSSLKGGRADGPFTWSFDIQCAGVMYMSYKTTEYWQLLENPPYGTAVHLVQGARSDRWPEAMQQRLNQAAVAAAAATDSVEGQHGSFQHHVLERAGHWLHVDNPEGLLRLVLPRLVGL